MALTPATYPVSINGRNYLAAYGTGKFGRQTVPLSRSSWDVSQLEGEHTLNPEDLWRRSFETWHRGSGQSGYDRPDSDPFRFNGSLGIDPWTKWQVSLLNDTERKLASTSTNTALEVAGSRLYAADNQTLKYTTDILTAGVSTWTSITGTPAVALASLCSDGNNVWAAFGASGIYLNTRSIGTASSWNNLNCSLLRYVKGRLMAAYANSIYNVTGPNTTAANAVKPTKKTATAVTSISVTTSYIGPPGSSYAQPVSENELLIVTIWVPSSTIAITAPAGWTLIRGDTVSTTGQLVAYWYRATAADAAATAVSGTWSFSGSTNAIAQLNRYTGVDSDSANPIDTSSSNSGTSATVTATGITLANQVGTMVLYVAGSTNVGTFTPPSSFTEQSDNNLAATGSMETADLAGQVAGATGNKSATASGSGDYVAMLIAIKSPVAQPLLTHANTDFTWVGFAEGLNDIYAAGYSGDKSLIYKTQVKPDGTALEVPSVAGQLPDGEIVACIYGYLGFVFIGSNKGLRMARSDANGDLVIGALITTPGTVRCFEGQDRFVWYGYEDFVATSYVGSATTYDGLGRLDLTQEILPVTPAYASDLMVTSSTGATETVTSVVTFQNRRVLAVADTGGASRGVYGEMGVKVATGYLDTGRISYGIADTKVATYLDLRHDALVGTVQVYLAANGGAMTSIGTSSSAGTTKPAAPLSAGPTRAEYFEVRLKLARSGSSDTVGPVVSRATLRSEPAPSRGKRFQVPLMLYETLAPNSGEKHLDVQTEIGLLEALFDSQTLVTYAERNASYQVFIEHIEFVYEKPTADRKFHQGICSVTLKAPGV